MGCFTLTEATQHFWTRMAVEGVGHRNSSLKSLEFFRVLLQNAAIGRAPRASWCDGCALPGALTPESLLTYANRILALVHITSCDK